MSDIKNLCSDIEDRLESFECCNDLRIDEIYIERSNRCVSSQLENIVTQIMSEQPEKPKAVLVGVFGAGPLFNDAAERRRERWYANRRGR